MFNKIINKAIEKKIRLLETFNKKQWIVLIVLFVLSIIIGK
jgi:hypothetical protein|tara:strand:- start:218 stop:340 length:123 start_codon:yes stop_codon:yes gene_type:complete